MKIVGNHDEQLLLKTQCANHAKCEYCALQPFCEMVQQKNYKFDTTYKTKYTYNDNTTNTIYYEWTNSTSNYKLYSNLSNLQYDETMVGNPLKLFQLEKFPTILIQKGDSKDASDI